MTLRTAFVAAILLIAPALPAAATGEIVDLITKADQSRLDKFDATREGALAEATAGGEVADRAALAKAIGGKPLPFDNIDLTGNWKCRTIKVGGTSPLVVYGWFNCRVTDDGSGWMLEKTSGSQRTTGRFFTDSDTRLIYLGTGYVAGEKPRKYGSGAEWDQVGYAYRDSASHWRIEFPAPYYESKLDILEFRR